MVRNFVDEVWSDQFGQERRNDIGKENHTFWDGGADKIESGGEDDYVEYIVDEAWLKISVSDQNQNSHGAL